MIQVRSLLAKVTQRGVVPDGIWRRLPPEPVFTIRSPRGRTFRYEGGASDPKARALRWRGFAAWEHESVTEFERLAEDATTIVDVGANTGIYTLVALAANPTVSVVAVEPVLRVAEQLRRNLRLNGWEDRVQVVEAAASTTAGSARLLVPERPLPASAHLEQARYRSATGVVTVVPQVALDDIVPTTELVKIDVEGGEHLVLGGMTRLLKDVRPHILAECLPEGPVQELQDIIDRFGYGAALLTASGPVNVSVIAPDPNRKLRNFLLSPIDRSE